MKIDLTGADPKVKIEIPLREQLVAHVYATWANWAAYMLNKLEPVLYKRDGGIDYWDADAREAVDAVDRWRQ